jgi:ribosomal subunit interface protein
MKMPLQVTFRDMVPLPSLEPEIRRRVAKLDLWAPDVMSCHVVVEAEGNRHHQGHVYRVKVSVRVTDEEIVAGDHHRNENIELALHGAFDALDRQLEDHVQRRRGHTKRHAAVIHGQIASLSDDGVGRIVSDAGDDYHFDRSQVAQPAFESLSVGQDVRFLEGATRAGREARRVCGA